MLHSIYDLTTFCRRTTGDIPAKLVGASTTVVGSKMYLFGGRLVSERRMVSDLYVFDLETLVWEHVPVSPDDDVPRPRYFHSTDIWNNMLIVFGGMSNQPDSINPDELCVLNDVRFFDIATRHWLPAQQPPIPVPESLPRARYAHLSSVTADRLFVIGGQDFNNTWLDDVCVYDLVEKAWVQRRDYERHCGTYRSVAVSSNLAVRLPQEEMKNFQTPSTLGPPGERFGPDRGAAQPTEFTPSESLVHLPYSAPPSEEHPADIYLYSNYNFTDVKRELEVFSPLPDCDFTIEDKSSAMAGTTFPPGLRFPTGAILGTNLIIAGTYLAHSYQSFSIWVLDLITMTWTRIDPGKAVESGSWFRGSLWAEANKFIIFGNKNGNLVDDYNRRLLSWEHVAVVDLEAFGIYQPPPLKLDITMQELGLAALEERIAADFEIVCEDGRRLPCSRRLLEDRWPWFLEQRKKFTQRVQQAMETLPDSAMHLPLPELPGNASVIDGQQVVDPRLTSRSLHLSEPYPISLALLQYFYTMALVTPLQHAPAVLSQLLVLATNYGLTHLETLVKHAMHRALSNSTSVGVYEVATLCSCRSLQIRALKTVMSYTQKRPSRSRDEKEDKPPGSSGGGGGGGPVNGAGGGGPANDSQYMTRPRGTSDARWRNMGSAEPNASGSGYHSRAQVHHEPETRVNYSRGGPSIADPKKLSDMWDMFNQDTSANALPSIPPRHPQESKGDGVYGHKSTNDNVESSFMQLNDVDGLDDENDESGEEDQITPLPTVRSTKAHHRGRTRSVASAYTENEIIALADLLADYDTGHSRIEQSSTSESAEYISPLRNDVLSTDSKCDSSSSFSPFIPTAGYSDSDHYSDGHLDNISLFPESYRRQRPPRILTDSMQSNPPSLTSSASYSSLSTGRYTSPSTPLNTTVELSALTEPPDLGIIDEHNAIGEALVPGNENIEFSNSGFFARDYQMKEWPQQRSNIHWIPPPPPPISPDDLPTSAKTTAPNSVYASTDNVTLSYTPASMSMTSLSPKTPRSPSGFSRLLRRKKSDLQDVQPTSPKQEKKTKIKEKKVKVEPPEQKRERLRRERLRDALGFDPMVMGGMVALG